MRTADAVVAWHRQQQEDEDDEVKIGACEDCKRPILVRHNAPAVCLACLLGGSVA